MKRRALGVALCLLGAGVAFAFAALTASCGMHRVSTSEPGEPPGEPRCVSASHPFAVPFGVAGLAACAAIWWGRAWLAITLGALLVALGVLAGLSMGLFGIGSGILVLAGGLVGRSGRPAAVPPVAGS